jgi:hypothetical protein
VRTIPVHFSGRQGGKTYATVKWLLTDPQNRVIVVPNEDFRRHTMRMLGQMSGIAPKKWERHVIAWDRDVAQRLRGDSKQIFIDQADIILRAMLGPHQDLTGVTWDV